MHFCTIFLFFLRKHFPFPLNSKTRAGEQSVCRQVVRWTNIYRGRNAFQNELVHPNPNPSRQSRASRRRQSRVEKFAFPKFFKFVKAAGQASRKRINFGFTRGSFEMSFQVGPNTPPPLLLPASSLLLTLHPRGLRKIITLWRRHTARSPWMRRFEAEKKVETERGAREREGERGMSVRWKNRN